MLKFPFPLSPLWLLFFSLFLLLTPSAQARETTLPSLETQQTQGNSFSLLQQGKQHYQNGELTQAAQVWEEAEAIFATQGDSLNQVQALNYLITVYQDLGDWQQAQERLEKSLDLLSNLSLFEAREFALYAQSLNNKASLQFAQGQTETALQIWQEAEDFYEKAGNETGKLGSQINQAQALQTLGQYRRAKSLLEELVKQLQSQPDSLLKVKGLQSLGVALQTIGDLKQSKEILEEGWTIAQDLSAHSEMSEILFSIGNVARDLGENEIAFAYYKEAEKHASNSNNALSIKLNSLSLLIETQKEKEALALGEELLSRLTAMSPSRSSIFAKANLAESLIKVNYNPQEIATLLAQAIQDAKQIKDFRAQAYSLYQLGKVYAESSELKSAQTLTQEALQLSQSIQAEDIIAQSAWQLGQILAKKENIKESLVAYDTAFKSLQNLRSDLVAISSDVQFDFREKIEPLYREYVSLLLTLDSQENLQKAREVIEALQIAELDNFFRDACLDTQPVQIDEIDTTAAVIYTIILPERLEVILSLPNSPLRHYSTPLSSSEVETKLQQFYSSLYVGYSKNERLRLAQEIYNWLIRPAEAHLHTSNADTLVFVLDGFLRNLPMSALHDGDQYLIENYSVALSPGLQLFPESLKGQKLAALTAGMTESRQGFPPLPAVQEEVAEIAQEVQAKVLLNEDFTLNAFQDSINNKSFPIVHLATHGQFSSNPKETFLLTWESRITIDDFDALFQKRRLGILEPIELLVLSACQTASGDNRATLGLAGLALRSGARSTLASLWSVNDESTAVLMSEFYRQLTQTETEITKAEALRNAQLFLLNNPEYDHPYFWSSFVLVGNWL